MIEKIAAALSWTGFGYNRLRRSLGAGEERPENKEFRIIKKLKDEGGKVQSVYDAKGKIIEYNKYGRHFDILR